jgi:hypothetical protein
MQTNLTRKGVIDLARELGLPLSKSWLDKLSMVGQGPKPLGRVGQRHVYSRDEALQWLKNLIKPIT